MRRKIVPQSLIDCLVYDETSSSYLRWKVSPGRRIKVGDEAGCIYGHYYRLTYQGSTYANHVVIWQIHNGPPPPHLDVDHEDNDKLRNKIDNLRLATHGQNQHNTSTRVNTLGVKGLYKYPGDKTYLGAISFQGKSHKFRSEDRSEVERWLVQKRTELHGTFARH